MPLAAAETWMAQELLSTFGSDLGAVTLVPGTGGAFRITIDGETIWERMRDAAWPERDLGHADRAG